MLYLFTRAARSRSPYCGSHEEGKEFQLRPWEGKSRQAWREGRKSAETGCQQGGPLCAYRVPGPEWRMLYSTYRLLCLQPNQSELEFNSFHVPMSYMQQTRGKLGLPGSGTLDSCPGRGRGCGSWAGRGSPMTTRGPSCLSCLQTRPGGQG